MGATPYRKEITGAPDGGGFYTFIGGAPTQALGVLLVLAGGEALGELLIGVGGLGIMVGLVLYGAATLQARVLPRWCGIALIVSLPVTILLEDYGGIFFGLVWLALGYMLWSHRGASSEQRSRVR